jgi:RecA-family ATPase
MFKGKASKNGKAGWDATGSGTANNTELPNAQSQLQLPDRTLGYMQNGASEGSRNEETFFAAQQMRDAGLSEQAAVVQLVPQAKASGISESEALRAIQSAYSRPPREPIGRGTQYSRPQPRRTPKFKKIETAPEKLPDYIEDGDRALIEAAFEPGELVWIGDTNGNEDGTRSPDYGVAFTREDWLSDISQRGAINKVMGDQYGLYVRVNPMRLPTEEEQKEAKANNQSIPLDTLVTSFRHCLIEADKGDKEAQLGAIKKIGLPIAAIIDSGGRSIHGWVRIDAKDREEYRERVALLHEFCRESLGLDVDKQNKNPSRYSRMPNGNRMRINKETGEPILGPDGKPIIDRQRLIQVNVPGKTWSEWIADVEAMQDWGDEEFSIDDLLGFDPANDPDNLLGNRWLGRGQTFILAGDSGKGKSSLLMKLVAGWALNKNPLGIQQTHPLKTLIVQDENNFGDMAEMLQGVLGTLDESQVAIIKSRVKIFRQSSKTGLEFVNYLRKKIEAIKPDVVICDPFVSYFEGELNSSSDSKQFLREWLGPVIRDTGVLFGFLHHVRKPEKRGTGQNGEKTDADLTLSYHDITGSGEVVRWAREVIMLSELNEDSKGRKFNLGFGKRDGRTGVANNITLRQATGGRIDWDIDLSFGGKATGEPVNVRHEKEKEKAKQRKEDLRWYVVKQETVTRAEVRVHADENQWQAQKCVDAVFSGFHKDGEEPRLYLYKNDEGVEVVSIHPKKVVTAAEKEDSEKAAVLDYLKRKGALDSKIVTGSELLKHAEDTDDSSFPPRKRVLDVARDLVDGKTVFTVDKMTLRTGVRASEVFSYGKPPSYFHDDIARRQGLPAYKPEITAEGPDPFGDKDASS